MVARDVLNMKSAMHSEDLEGRTATQNFLRILIKREDAIVETAFARPFHGTANEDNGPLEYVFWTYRSCIEMFKENSEVICVDKPIKPTGLICL